MRGGDDEKYRRKFRLFQVIEEKGRRGGGVKDIHRGCSTNEFFPSREKMSNLMELGAGGGLMQFNKSSHSSREIKGIVEGDRAAL